MDRILSQLGLVRQYSYDGDVVTMCTICDGRLSYNNCSLGLVVEMMLSHLAVNHAERLDDEI